ncbi:MAG: Holliday junction branch migration protein RuvA [Lachnospiraceae bacterium]|nr:Holliday junction branch migration protein RuvA [Lachnospiraceae bacterium]
MISYIKGILQEIYDDSLIVETGGIGYQIQAPVSMLSQSSIGKELKVYTYLSMGQDQAPRLYGFSSKEDLDIFKRLIGVSGIGPKGAIGILSAVSPDDLRFAVLSEDAKTITRAPGIGIKTAKKLILELKDKFKLEEAFELKRSHEEALANQESGRPLQSGKEEAVQALAALGYSASEALKAVNGIDNAEELSVEDLLKAALRQMSRF